MVRAFTGAGVRLLLQNAANREAAGGRHRTGGEPGAHGIGGRPADYAAAELGPVRG
jgi:hypothetical protein